MIEDRLDRKSVLGHYKNVKKSNLLDIEDNAFVLYDFDILFNRIEIVKNAFGDTFSHTVAIKSNPLSKVLKAISKKHFGLECASFEEVIHANRLANSERIIWDSPAKTKLELKKSESISNLIINANDLQELDKVLHSKVDSILGLRINPLESATELDAMNVSSMYSKFGEPITSAEEIIQRIIKSPSNVSAIHVHTSSQNTDFKKQVQAIRRVLDLVLRINLTQPRRIKYFNIGGGFPASYNTSIHFSIADYAQELKARCPELFDGQFEVLTEFGRYYHANSGVAFSTIESVKSFEKHQTIIHHLGADFFLRESYNPDQWPHEFSILRNTELIQTDDLETDIGGPLCFGGDYISKNTQLPKANCGDQLVISDVGANTFSLWSRHCSRPFPKIIAHEAGKYFVLKEKELSTEVSQFWD